MVKRRGLSANEAALWARVAATVEAMEDNSLLPSRSPSLAFGSGEGLGVGPIVRAKPSVQTPGPTPLRLGSKLPSLVAPPLKRRGIESQNTQLLPSPSGEGLGVGAIVRTPTSRGGTSPAPTPPQNTLDAKWDRRLGKGEVAPDFTLDLHGHSLDAAWGRLNHGLTLAQAQGARLVLVITGKPRPVEAADRGRQRGAIRAKLMDWLASGSHASKIAAVRSAHPRHGGAGAVYVVLRKAR